MLAMICCWIILFYYFISYIINYIINFISYIILLIEKWAWSEDKFFSSLLCQVQTPDQGNEHEQACADNLHLKNNTSN